MNVAVRELQTLFEVGSLGGLSDGQLLGRFVERREGAVFEAIVRRHGPMVWGVCRRVLRDRHDAEDAFQTTFLVLARKAASIMVREKLGHWLYGVAYQTSMKARAMRARRRGREGQVPDMPEPVMMPDDLRDEVAESLDRELSRLPEKYRIPVVLCELEGMSHKEAAEQLGWPIGTVSSRLSGARAMLATRLSRRGMSLSVGSLAVLLAQEASASMPTRLIGPTAQAASLFAAGGAVTAGVVSAGVAALTREVLKMMLLGKLKIGVVMLLVASAVAAGGTGLAFQAPTIKPGQKEGQKEELRRLIDRDKLQGTWRTVSGERFGEPLSKRENGWTDEVVFKGDEITIKRAMVEDFVSNLKIDPDKTPKEIDFGNIPGIYELDGDGLKLCFNLPLPGPERPLPRPTKLAGTGPHRVLLVLKRVKGEDQLEIMKGHPQGKRPLPFDFKVSGYY